MISKMVTFSSDFSTPLRLNLSHTNHQLSESNDSQESFHNYLFTGNKVGLYPTEMNRDVLMPERSEGINISRFIEVNKVPLFPSEYVIFFSNFFDFLFRLYFPMEIKFEKKSKNFEIK